MALVDHESLNRGFFRGIDSTALFRRFFEHFGVWDQMGIADDSRPETIYLAWSKLDPETHADLHESIRRVNDLGHEKGRWALLYRARDCRVEGCDDLTPLVLSMTMFLEHRQVFDEVYGFYTIEKTDSLDILIGRDPVPCDPTEDQLQEFRNRLVRTLKREAVGDGFRVEVAEPRHPKKWMVVVPHETQAKDDFEFDEDGEIVNRPRRPIYDIVLIYYPDTGMLKIKAGRGKRKANDVAECFATEILNRPPDHFRVCKAVSLDPLRDPEFSFTRAPGDSFKWVRPRRIRFRKRADAAALHDVQYNDDADGGKSVVEYLESDGVRLSALDVESLTLRFMFMRHDRDFRDVTISTSERCTLDDTNVDRSILRVLVRWGLLDPSAKERLSSAGPN
jgi:hypothetical protein